MDKQKQNEEMAKDLKEEKLYALINKTSYMRSAENLYDLGYRKIPENAVVLTREDMNKYAEDCIAGQEIGLDIINALIARAERYKEQAKQTRKETAEKFAERLKIDFDEILLSNTPLSKIDEICKEIGG